MQSHRRAEDCSASRRRPAVPRAIAVEGCASPVHSRSIEFAIRVLRQSRDRIRGVRGPALRTEAIERGQSAGRFELEDRSEALGTAEKRRPIEIPVAGLYQSARWSLAIRAGGQSAEVVEC